MKHLIFHGSVILFIGLICGAPFGRAIVRGESEATVRAWRAAHAGVVMGGVLLLALAAVVLQLRLSTIAVSVLVWSFIASGYGFALALPVGAYYGYRGLKSEPPFINRVIYFGNIVGVVGSLVGAVLLMVGAYAAL
jgi:hypothetical protein